MAAGNKPRAVAGEEARTMRTQQTQTYYCEQTGRFAVFDSHDPEGIGFGEWSVIASGRVRRDGELWRFADGRRARACRGFKVHGTPMLGPNAPKGCADATFASKWSFDRACVQMCGLTLEEHAGVLGAALEDA